MITFACAHCGKPLGVTDLAGKKARKPCSTSGWKNDPEKVKLAGR